MATAQAPTHAVLDNGLVVLAAPVRGSSLVATTLLYRVGSYHEVPGKTGLAHLMEHMMFRGTERYPRGAIDAATGARGGVNNALTTADYTAYYFVLPAEHWRVPLELEADRMFGCTLDRASFEVEKRVAIEERKMFDDDPEAALDEAVDSIALTRHPYRHPVVGLREDLPGLGHDDLRSFYRAHYGPNNAVLAVAGDVDPERVIDAAREHFGDLSRVRLSSASPIAEPPQTTPRRVVIEREDAAAPQAVVVYRCPSATDENAPAVEVLAAILGTGRGSLLHRRFVVGDAIAAEVSAMRLLQRDPGLFYVAAQLHPDVEPETFEDGALSIIEELRGSGVTEEDVERAKNVIRLDLLLGRETCLGLSGALGFWETLGGWRLGDAYEERLDAVRPDDVARVLEIYFDPDSRSSAWLTPRGE